MNGRTVGQLNREKSGAVDFRYATAWLDWDNAFPISLSLPLRDDRYIGSPVINVLANLLPDSESIRRRVAERVGADGTDVYSLLSALGRDCVGALQFLDEDQEPGRAGEIEGKPISDGEIEALLDRLAIAPLGVDRDAEFRISIAGAQEKTALLLHEGRWLKPSGTTATTHILKPQIGELPNGIDLTNSVENEYLSLVVAKALGVQVTDAQIIDFGRARALVVKRFDRQLTSDSRLLRLPQEDCCQALGVPPSRKYEADGGPSIRDVVELLRGSDRPDDDVATFLRANLVFWLLGATDGHAKNFSIFLSLGGRFRLTPIYDVLSAQPTYDDGRISQRQFKLAMSVGKNRHYGIEDIMPRHFVETAELSGIGRIMINALIEELADTASARVKRALESVPHPVPDVLIASLDAAVARRSQLLGRCRPE